MYSGFWPSARLKCVLRGTSCPSLELPRPAEVAHSRRSCEGGLFSLLNGCFCFRGVCAGGRFPFLPLLLLLLAPSQSHFFLLLLPPPAPDSFSRLPSSANHWLSVIKPSLPLWAACATFKPPLSRSRRSRRGDDDTDTEGQLINLLSLFIPSQMSKMMRNKLN